VVQKVGPNTRGWDIGDHVVFSFLPACGRCHWCATGHQNLCDVVRAVFPVQSGRQPRLRMNDGTNVDHMLGISTFAAHTIAHVNSAIKVDKDLPLEKLCLLGCGVGTDGLGGQLCRSRPSDTVIIMGIGGVASTPSRGGARRGDERNPVDPVAFKAKRLSSSAHARLRRHRRR